MTGLNEAAIGRRLFLGGAAASALLALPGCASMGGYSLTEAIRRLLFLSSERAFARLTRDGGYWDDAIGDVGLGNLLGTRGDILATILTSTLFKGRLERAFAGVAEKASYRAAPIVTEAVRTIGVENAVALVKGGPTAATGFLRDSLGVTLVEAMVPEVGDAMRVAQDPLMGQLLSALTGIDLANATRSVSRRVDDAIWREMGVEEAAIRADPRATNDPLLIGVFGVM